MSPSLAKLAKKYLSVQASTLRLMRECSVSVDINFLEKKEEKFKNLKNSVLSDFNADLMLKRQSRPHGLRFI